jgi:hypothetical protein
MDSEKLPRHYPPRAGRIGFYRRLRKAGGVFPDHSAALDTRNRNREFPHWDVLLEGVPLRFLFSTNRSVTAPVVLNEMLGSMFGVSWGPLFSATALQLLPILILILLFQGILISGISHGSDK